MRHSDRKSVIAAALAALGILAAEGAVAGPNLTPNFNPYTGEVTVQNIGNGLAPGSWVTINCSGACPEPPAAQVGPYLNPGLSNKLSVNVPNLFLNQSFSHTVVFWDDLVFPAGNATFQVCSDALGGIAEDSERDNCVNVQRTSKRALSPSVALPQPKLRLKN